MKKKKTKPFFNMLMIFGTVFILSCGYLAFNQIDEVPSLINKDKEQKEVTDGKDLLGLNIEQKLPQFEIWATVNDEEQIKLN